MSALCYFLKNHIEIKFDFLKKNPSCFHEKNLTTVCYCFHFSERCQIFVQNCQTFGENPTKFKGEIQKLLQILQSLYFKSAYCTKLLNIVDKLIVIINFIHSKRYLRNCRFGTKITLIDNTGYAV